LFLRNVAEPFLFTLGHAFVQCASISRQVFSPALSFPVQPVDSWQEQ